MDYLAKLFFQLRENNPDIDICDLADILALAQNLSQDKSKQYSKIEESKEDKNKQEQPLESAKETKKPKVIDIGQDNKSNIPSNITDDKLSHDYQFAKTDKTNPLEVKLDTTYKISFDLSKQLMPLNQRLKVQSTKIIDENKTASFIADTKIFNPIFKLESKKYFSLTLIIDQNNSMFLWDEKVKRLLNQMRQIGVFQKLHIYYLDTTSLSATLYKDKNRQAKTSVKQEVVLKDRKNIILLLSDCTSMAWKSNDVYENYLAYWMKYSFVAVMQTLPFYMWMKSTLGRGVEVQFSTAYRNPTNTTLLHKKRVIDKSPKSLNIPILSFDKGGFGNLSSLIRAKDKSKVQGIVLNNYRYTSEIKKQPKMSAKERYEHFKSVASIDAQELAIYCSVLPLTLNIIQMVQKQKNLNQDIGIIAEFYFGKIIYYDKDTKEFRFYKDETKNIRATFRNKLPTDEAFELAISLSDEIKKSFDLPVGYKELFHQNYDGNLSSLSSHDKEIIDIFIDTLNRRGGMFREKGEKLRIKTTSIEVEIAEDKNDKPTKAIIPQTKRFQMGSDDGRDNEKPVHEVVINHDFEISQYPITVGEFRTFIKDTGYKTEAQTGDGAYVWDGKDWNKEKDAYWDNPYFEQTDDHPVVCISWNDAQEYCKWISKKTSENYRLPTEAEWEYSCRAGTTTKWSFGDAEKELEKYAWYGKKGGKKTHPVGEKLSNPWGLYDMHGNVWEWCEDDFVDNYKETPRDGSANEKGEKKYKVLRGGSWVSDAGVTRSAIRSRDDPANRGGSWGFRLLRTLPSDLGDS